MRRISFGLMALEQETPPPVAGDTVAAEDQGSATAAAGADQDTGGDTLATEGFKGAVYGAVAGLFLGGVSGAVMSNQVERKKKEIESIAHELELAAIDAGEKAVKEGKLSAEDFKKNVKVGTKGVIRGLVYGTLFGAIYGAIKGSELEDLHEELEQRCKELNRILEKQKPAASANESADLQLATEGFKGAVYGAVAGMFLGGVAGGVMSNQVERKKKQIEQLAQELEKAAVDAGEQAVKAGKLSAEDFKKNIKVGAKGVIRGVVYGTLFGAVYGAIKGSELEDLKEELDQQCKELNRILEKKTGKPATEGLGVSNAQATAEMAAAVADTHPAVDPLPAAPDEVETGLIEYNGQETEAAQVAEQTEAAGDVVASLEALAETLRASLPTGGISRESANMMHVAVDHMYGQVGFVGGRKAMPSLESYGSVERRDVATRLAMEDIAEKAKLIWQKIIEALKKAIAWLAQRVGQAINIAGMTEKRAKELLALTEKVGETAAQAATIANPGLLRAVHVHGKGEASGIVNSADRVAKAVEGVYKDALKRVETLEKILASGTIAEADLLIQQLAPEPGFIQYHVVADPAAEGLPAVGENKVMTRSDEMPGGKAILVIYPDASKESNPIAAIAGSAVTISDGWPHAAVSEETQLETLKGLDAQRLCNIVVRICQTLQGFQQGLKAIEAAKTKVLADAERISNAAEGEQTADKRALAGLVMASGKLIDNPIAGLSGYAVNVSRALLNYVDASLRQYGVQTSAAGAAVDKTKEVAGQVADKAKEVAGKTADAVKEGAEKAGAAVKEGVDKAKAAVAGDKGAAPAAA